MHRSVRSTTDEKEPNYGINENLRACKYNKYCFYTVILFLFFIFLVFLRESMGPPLMNTVKQTKKQQKQKQKHVHGHFYQLHSTTVYCTYCSYDSQDITGFINGPSLDKILMILGCYWVKLFICSWCYYLEQRKARRIQRNKSLEGVLFVLRFLQFIRFLRKTYLWRVS